MIDQMAGEFAAVAVALYAAHHVGDYWVQTDHQARHKGNAGSDGVVNCLLHVTSYLMTQNLLLLAASLVLGLELSVWGIGAGLLVSGVTHYVADRREHGLMFKLARLLPSKVAFMELGCPRDSSAAHRWNEVGDNPQLATGAWALDQSWHIFWGVFVAALLVVTL